MEKILGGKTPLGEFQVTTPEESTNKKSIYEHKEYYPIGLSWSTYLQYNLLSYTNLSYIPQLDMILQKNFPLHESPYPWWTP